MTEVVTPEKPVVVPGIERAIAAAGSEAALGELLGVTQQAVNRMKKRGYAPRDRVEQIANAFGIPRADLIDPALKGLLE